MFALITRCSAAIGGAARALALGGGAILLCLMVLTVLDVTLRKANHPIFGAQDISEGGLVVVVFLAMAYTGWTGGHIAVDLIGNAFKPRTLQWFDFGVRLVSGAFFVLVTWKSVTGGLDALEFGDGFNLLDIPHWPFYFVIAFGSAVFTLVLFLLALRSAAGMPDIKMH